MFNLQNDDVPDGGYWGKLNKLSSAGMYGEPFFEHGIGPKIGEWMIDKGLAEEVKERPWPSRHPCYRVTALGEALIKRGKDANGPPKRHTLPRAPTRIPTARPRIKAR
jgi:hypothetical protein